MIIYCAEILKKLWRNVRIQKLVFRSFWLNFGIRKNFVNVFRKLEKFCRNIKVRKIWITSGKKFLKIFENLQKIRREFQRNRKQLFEEIVYITSVEISYNFQGNLRNWRKF